MHLQAGFTALGLALLVGCASSTETPRGADESTETTVSSGLSEIETQPIAAPEPAAAAECTPGETRACKKTWSDSRGQLHCLSANQFCNTHGSGWLECGEVPGEGE